MPTLKRKEVVSAPSDRYRLMTESTGEARWPERARSVWLCDCTRGAAGMGRPGARRGLDGTRLSRAQVHLRLSVLTKDFSRFGVST